ncbi:MAG: hypothetical protein APU95_01750 [Hadesarchaea archaeon YNP_N21]|jgi:4-hydroxy-tetrahydrodipicolinate synthase|nr:MAG: hypothetical protein APU95_01750 [Hadesarchaea archaeon YNP_N21]
MEKADLSGIIPATILPMKKDYTIDEDSLENYVKWISDFKIIGLAVNVDTGEGPHLHEDERKRVLEVVKEIVKSRKIVIAGVPARFTSEALKIAADAKQAGADALLVFPAPSFAGQPLPVQIPYEYHKAIGDSVDLPIILFQLRPVLGGVEYTSDCLAKLTEIRQVVALKDASFDAKKFVETIRALRRAPRRITLLTGNDDFILESFLLGADGALLGFGALVPDLLVEMFDCVKKQKLDEAKAIADRLKPLVDVIFAEPVRDYRARIKEALTMLGVIKTAHVRPPLLPISDQERRRIKETLKKVGIL